MLGSVDLAFFFLQCILLNLVKKTNLALHSVRR